MVELTWKTKTTKDVVGSALTETWETECRCYRVTKVTCQTGEVSYHACYDDGGRWWAVAIDYSKSRSTPKDYATLTGAFSAILSFHEAAVGGKKVCQLNTDGIISREESTMAKTATAKKTSPKTEAKVPKAGKIAPTRREVKETGKDSFGSRLGSSLAKANACLTKTPKTMAEIVKEAELTDTVYTHFRKLVGEGLIVQTDDGYQLKA